MKAIEAKLTALLPWFGSKRTMAPEIVRQLGPHNYYFEPCAGSMAVLFAKPVSSHELVCDLHGGLTNLALCVQDSVLAAELFNRLQLVLYSDSVYARSCAWLADNEPVQLLDESIPEVDWAYHYFLASWMGRNGVAGTARVNYQIATRWTQGGGSGPLRFRHAVDSIPAWCERLKNVHILRRNMFDVLPKIVDAPGVAIYCDPPYLDETVAPSSRYLHGLTLEGEDNKKVKPHERLAQELGRFRTARVVVSYYDAPVLKELYPPPQWSHLDCSRHKNLHTQNKRGASRKEAPEVLLVNGPVFEESKVKLF